MHPNARPTTPTTPTDTLTTPTDTSRSTARPASESPVLRLLQALGGAAVVVLLGFLLVTARVAHGEARAEDAPRTGPAVEDVEAPAVEPAGAAGVHAPARNAARPAADRAPEAASKPAKALGRGEASYYHHSLEGRPTASGEPYLGDRLTAAHRSLPIGSKVRVTDLQSGKAVTVRINDRGPFHGHRVIDLSHAAARQLGMVSRGTARVSLELLTA